MILGVTKEPLSPTWPNVAFYFGAVAVFSIVIGLRFLDFRRDMIRQGKKTQLRGATISGLIFVGLAVGYGIALIVRTANS